MMFISWTVILTGLLVNCRGGVAFGNHVCYHEFMNKKPKKFYWHASTSSGGTLSLSLDFESELSKKDKESALAKGLMLAYKFMEKNGYIPFKAQLLSSRDIAEKYGKSRQYWEKLLNEGKILYKETSAGRITTDLWIKGYLGSKEEVDKYVKNVRSVIKSINESGRKAGTVTCPACGVGRFEFFVNTGGNTNGICRDCNLHVIQ